MNQEIQREITAQCASLGRKKIINSIEVDAKWKALYIEFYQLALQKNEFVWCEKYVFRVQLQQYIRVSEGWNYLR